jgi:glutamate dehydrogenase/leucine dehydrogenase
MDPKKSTAAVQGFGNVGFITLCFFTNGVKIVAVSGRIRLHIQRRWTRHTRAYQVCREEQVREGLHGARRRRRYLETKVDILAPCASGKPENKGERGQEYSKK